MNNMMIIGIIGVLAIAAFVFMYKPQPPVTEIEGEVEVTSEEEYLIEDELITLLNEQLDQMEGELTEYNEQIESDMSSDMGMFYYD